MTVSRSRWAAFGAALAVSVGAGGLLTASAAVGSGERAVFVPITPCRLIDTRPAPDTVGGRTSPLGPGETFPVTVRGSNGNCVIPVDAVGVVMNLAIISPTENSFLTVFPSDATRPLSASANWLSGDAPKSNAVTADLSADGRVSFYNLAGTVHIAVDLVGYFVDHHHNDLYYTKSEVDAKLATKPAAAYAQRSGVSLPTEDVPVEVVKLTDAGSTGALTLMAPSRLVITGAVTIGNSAGTGPWSVVTCQLQIDPGSGFAPIGLMQGTESHGDSNHDERYNIALTAGVDRPAGTYNVRIMCTDDHKAAGSAPVARWAALTVMAVPT